MERLPQLIEKILDQFQVMENGRLKIFKLPGEIDLTNEKILEELTIQELRIEIFRTVIMNQPGNLPAVVLV